MKQPEIKINMPAAAAEIVKTLQQAGFEAYVVGGCVRDSILGREPKDWDITTSALPGQVKKLFRRTIDTGIAHGTVTVMRGAVGYEITTYRIDGKYEDSRHPKEVTFTPNLTEDLLRRDFTINAMAYNDEAGLVDLYGGLEDMERKVIRCVGNAHDRFSEDALRMMRAVRFSAQLGYTIEEETARAIRALAPTLVNISAERVREELIKLLCSPNPDFLRDAYALGVTKVILPEFDACMETPQNHPHHIYNVGEHILHALAFTEPEKNLRLAVLLHDVGKPATLTVAQDGITHFYNHAQVGTEMARKIMRRLKFDNDTTDVVCRLVYYHDYGYTADVTPKFIRRTMHKIGAELFLPLLAVKYADASAQSSYLQKEKLARIKKWRAVYDQVTANQECVSLKTLAVKGGDLMQIGYAAGPGLGVELKRLLELVLEDPARNEKEYLLREAQKALKNKDF